MPTGMLENYSKMGKGVDWEEIKEEGSMGVGSGVKGDMRVSWDGKRAEKDIIRGYKNNLPFSGSESVI